MKYPDLAGGANKMSLNQAREAYRNSYQRKVISGAIGGRSTETTFAKDNGSAGIAS